MRGWAMLSADAVPVHSPEPLSAHRLFATGDLDEARDIVARAFCRHRLSIRERGTDLNSLHNQARGKGLSLNYLRYGAAVTIEPGELERFYLIQVPLSGGADIRNGTMRVLARPGVASVLNPTLDTSMIWSADCRKVLVQIDRHALHSLAERWLGHRLEQPVVFESEALMANAGSQHWARLMWRMISVFDSVQAASLPQDFLEETFLTAFLEAQPSTISHFVRDRRYGAGPKPVKRAQAYIHAHLAEDFSMTTLAEEAGCSLRALQLGFNETFGLSPLRYLMRERLNMAHYLLRSGKGEPVSDIADRVGLGHHGRFSAQYRAKFGRSPSLARDALAREGLARENLARA